MFYWCAIPAVAAILGGSGIFAFAPKLRRFHKFMGFTLIFEGLMLLLSGSIFTGTSSFYLPTYLLYLMMLLVSPFFYYFAMRFLLDERGAGRKDFWMLEAVAVFIIIYLAVIPSIGQGERDAFFGIVTGRDFSRSGTGVSVLLSFDTLACFFFLVEQLFIQAYCFISLSKYQKMVGDYYSSLEGKSIPEVRFLLALMLLRLIVFGIAVFFQKSPVPVWLAAAQTGVFVAFYVLLAVYVCHIGYTAEELGRMLAAQNVKASVPAANDVIEARINSLVSEKFFLDPEIDLVSLSSRIQVNTRYVSDFIHFHYGETFLAFVNRLRVEHAAELLSRTSLSVNDIAEQSGFVNASTFYRNFLKVKGINPSQYRSEIRRDTNAK